MQRFRNLGYITLLFLLLATPAWAIFIERFDPVWEESSAGGGAGGEGFTEPTTGMEFVFVKGGCYQMGDLFGADFPDEKPVHEVCIDDFSLGKTEVTVGQFRKFVDTAGYKTEAEQGHGCYIFTGKRWGLDRSKNWRDPGFSQNDSHPVACVSWNDAKAFVDWSAQKSGKALRLPTEAEWEYAARSGGKQEKYAGGDNIDAGVWYASNSGNSSHPVGQKQANGLGLFDMSGNVWEWTGDWYGDKYYAESPKSNPLGPSGGWNRVLRGGSWGVGPGGGVRSVDRGGHTPESPDNCLGFRLAFSAR